MITGTIIVQWLGFKPDEYCTGTGCAVAAILSTVVL